MARILETTGACRYMRHISDSIRVGVEGSRFGSTGAGVSEEEARERRSSEWML